MTVSVASGARWADVATALPADRETFVGERPRRGRTGRPRGLSGWIEDAVFMLLAVMLLPLVILLVGAPVVLVVRLLLEIAERM